MAGQAGLRQGDRDQEAEQDRRRRRAYRAQYAQTRSLADPEAFLRSEDEWVEAEEIDAEETPGGAASDAAEADVPDAAREEEGDGGPEDRQDPPFFADGHDPGRSAARVGAGRRRPPEVRIARVPFADGEARPRVIAAGESLARYKRSAHRDGTRDRRLTLCRVVEYLLENHGAALLAGGPIDVTQRALARAVGLSTTHLSECLSGAALGLPGRRDPVRFKDLFEPVSAERVEGRGADPAKPTPVDLELVAWLAEALDDGDDVARMTDKAIADVIRVSDETVRKRRLVLGMRSGPARNKKQAGAPRTDAPDFLAQFAPDDPAARVGTLVSVLERLVDDTGLTGGERRLIGVWLRAARGG